jgi:hypothetical protein
MNTHTLDNKQKKRCIFVKENGNTCGALQMKNSEFCYFHNPAVSDERQETKRNGGKKKILVVNDTQTIPIKLDTSKQVAKFYSKLINDIYTGMIDIRLATGIGYLLNGLLKALELSEVEERISKLEKKLNTQLDKEGENKLTFEGWD